MIDEALEMLNALKNGRKIPESEIAEMVNNLTSRAKDLEHEVEVLDNGVQPI
jgi:archaellum component FlaC